MPWLTRNTSGTLEFPQESRYQTRTCGSQRPKGFTKKISDANLRANFPPTPADNIGSKANLIERSPTMKLTTRRFATIAMVSAFSLFICSVPRARAQQKLSSFDRDRGRQMLDIIKDDIKKNYYDPAFHGIDLDTHFKTADEKIKQATSLGQMFGIIAQTLIDFDDSHLYFVPPGRSTRYDYGWRMEMIGDKCFVTAVKPESDAAAKGLQPGDEIYSIDGYEPTRENH